MPETKPSAPVKLLEISHGRLHEVWTLHYAESAVQSHVAVRRAWMQDDGTLRWYERPVQRFGYRDLPRVIAALQKASRLLGPIRCAEVVAEMAVTNASK